MTTQTGDGHVLLLKQDQSVLSCIACFACLLIIVTRLSRLAPWSKGLLQQVQNVLRAAPKITHPGAFGGIAVPHSWGRTVSVPQHARHVAKTHVDKATSASDVVLRRAAAQLFASLPLAATNQVEDSALPTGTITSLQTGRSRCVLLRHRRTGFRLPHDKHEVQRCGRRFSSLQV